MTSEAIVGLLADETRLRITAAIVLDPGTSDAVASRAGVPIRAALEALTRLESGGLIRRAEGGVWEVSIETLRDAARTARPERDRSAASPDEVVLRTFIVDGRLAQIPAARSKRLVVLNRLAAEFEPGAQYDEPAVNDILRAWHEDVAALRRYLVDEAFLSRDHGSYWRTGGTVDVAG